MIWKDGYEKGDYISELYDDVFPTIKKWKDEGSKISIYSSGSIQAQKLLFKYTGDGDLTPLFSSYYDTTVGHKRETSSYINIVEDLKTAPKNVWFLSDISEELDAAKASGMNTIQLVRPGTTVCDNHAACKDFIESDKYSNK